MKLYLTTLVGLLSVTACSKNEPADNPDVSTSTSEVHSATTDTTELPVVGPEDSRAIDEPARDSVAVADHDHEHADKKPADNTVNNKGDGSSAALTPTDQQENESDLKLTQKIRQAVIADDSLSFNAKNAKIITQNGKVTLRGAVDTDRERSALAGIAKKVAGVQAVDNQLEVKN